MSDFDPFSPRRRDGREDSFVTGFKFTLGATVAIASVVAAVLVAFLLLWAMSEAGRSYFTPRENPARPGNPWRSD